VLISRAVRDGLTPTGEVVNLSLGWELAQMPNLVWFFGALVFVFELFFPLILLVRDWRLKLLALLGATIFHLFYPFVFVTFFNMNLFHEWLMGKLRLRKVATVPAAQT
jgi:hypothetical protein